MRLFVRGIIFLRFMMFGILKGLNIFNIFFIIYIDIWFKYEMEVIGWFNGFVNDFEFMVFVFIFFELYVDYVMRF